MSNDDDAYNHYRRNDPTFVEDLLESDRHVRRVADRLTRALGEGGPLVEVQELRIRPDESKMAEFSDDGDIHVQLNDAYLMPVVASFDDPGIASSVDQGLLRVQVDLGGTPVVVSRAADGGVRAFIEGSDGQELGSVAVTPVYWFAWSNFYPNTKVVD